MKKILLLVLDGFGINPNDYGNAIKKSDMPTFDSLMADYPNMLLEASGEAVGLPDGQFGNSEVGHMTIGAGRKIKQDIELCNEILGSSLIEHNEKLVDFISNIIKRNGTLHLMGLVSDGGVHSDIQYMKNLIKHLSNMGVKNIKFHVITDGRDTDTKSASKYIDDLEAVLKENGYGGISDICGRYYAMDRDNKWNRTKVYTDLLFNRKGVVVSDYKIGIEACYKHDITDEFLPPIIIDESAGLNDNDGLFWLNFRGDRARQILTVLKNPDFDEYKVKQLENFDVLTLVDVPNTLNLEKLIEESDQPYSLGVYFSDLGLRQARIAETEKYAHVTFFFNGGGKTKLKGCDNFLIPSPKVATYDLQPEMSVEAVTDQLIKCIEKDYDFILCNIANPDMIGHTGKMNAAVSALETVDKCLARIIEAVDDNFYKLIVTADHGNCDEMLSENGDAITTHSTYPVPFIMRDKYVKLRKNGDLTMIAPTILKYMDIAIPADMKNTKILLDLDE